MSAIDVACDGEGDIIHQICDESGEETVSIRRLAHGLIAVDVTGNDALALAKHFLPKTQIGKKSLATGKLRWRFLYDNPSRKKAQS
jgi:hypothetical protein